MSCQIRYIKNEDYPQIAELFKELHDMHVGWHPEIYKESKKEELFAKEECQFKTDNERVIVAVKDNEIIGVIEFDYKRTNSMQKVDVDILSVSRMIVKEPYRRKGIGTRLLNAVKEKANKENFGGILISADTMNPDAIHLYEKMGFNSFQIKLFMAGDINER